MKEHVFPIKALTWTGEIAREELTDNGLINMAGYTWEPKTDRLKIHIPWREKEGKIHKRHAIL